MMLGGRSLHLFKRHLDSHACFTNLWILPRQAWFIRHQSQGIWNLLLIFFQLFKPKHTASSSSFPIRFPSQNLQLNTSHVSGHGKEHGVHNPANFLVSDHCLLGFLLYHLILPNSQIFNAHTCWCCCLRCTLQLWYFGIAL